MDGILHQELLTARKAQTWQEIVEGALGENHLVILCEMANSIFHS